MDRSNGPVFDAQYNPSSPPVSYPTSPPEPPGTPLHVSMFLIRLEAPPQPLQPEPWEVKAEEEEYELPTRPYKRSRSPIFDSSLPSKRPITYRTPVTRPAPANDEWRPQADLSPVNGEKYQDLIKRMEAFKKTTFDDWIGKTEGARDGVGRVQMQKEVMKRRLVLNVGKESEKGAFRTSEVESEASSVEMVTPVRSRKKGEKQRKEDRRTGELKKGSISYREGEKRG